MNITHVKHLQEALQRFNPDAYLEPHLDVQGVSPQTLCVITSGSEDGLQGKIDELMDEVEKLEKKLTGIEEECENESPSIEKIKSLSAP